MEVFALFVIEVIALIHKRDLDGGALGKMDILVEDDLSADHLSLKDHHKSIARLTLRAREQTGGIMRAGSARALCRLHLLSSTRG
jgi:hypothetical protein